MTLILDAARSLFGRKGYAQTSVDEIADAARVTKGAVYHHFAGKEALFRAVYAEVETDAQVRVLRAGNAGMAPVDQMVAMMNAYLDAALDVEIRRITLVDGPAIVGQEIDEGNGVLFGDRSSEVGQRAQHYAWRDLMSAA